MTPTIKGDQLCKQSPNGFAKNWDGSANDAEHAVGMGWSAPIAGLISRGQKNARVAMALERFGVPHRDAMSLIQAARFARR